MDEYENLTFLMRHNATSSINHATLSLAWSHRCELRMAMNVYLIL